jgi:hypothetical protein
VDPGLLPQAAGRAEPAAAPPAATVRSPRFDVRSPAQGLRAIQHPVITKNFNKALRVRPKNRKAVLVPCAGTKPFPDAPSHKHGYMKALAGKQLDVYVVSEPLGVVPYEWSRRYPQESYDFPPAHLRGAGRELLVDRIADWFERGPRYEKVYLALPGHHLRLVQDALAQFEELPTKIKEVGLGACLDSGACPPGHFRPTSEAYRGFLKAKANPPLGAWWITPQVAAKLRAIERGFIKERSRLRYQYPLNEMVCREAPFAALELVKFESGEAARIEQGGVAYPGIETWHFWIRMGDGTIVDVASSQFGQQSPLVIPPGHPLQSRYRKVSVVMSSLCEEEKRAYLASRVRRNGLARSSCWRCGDEVAPGTLARYCDRCEREIEEAKRGDQDPGVAANPVDVRQYDPKSPPSFEGTHPWVVYTAIELDDGTIWYDGTNLPHVMVMMRMEEDAGIPMARVVDGGWIERDGVYHRGSAHAGPAGHEARMELNPFGLTAGQIAGKVAGWTATGAVADVITSRINRWITGPVTRAAEGALVKGAGAIVGKNPPAKVCDPSKRPLKLGPLKGKFVRTHVNLHNGCFVVSYKSKVRGYSRSLKLKNVRPRVGRAGWERCNTEQVRNVHAYLDGELVGTAAKKTGRGWREISYHCKTHGPYFFYVDTDEPFEGSAEAICRKVKVGDRERPQVFVRGPVPARKNPSCACGTPRGVCSCGEVDAWIEGDPEKITPCGTPPKEVGVHLVQRPWGAALVLLDVHNIRNYSAKDWHERGRCPLLAGFSGLAGVGAGARIAREGMLPELEHHESKFRVPCPPWEAPFSHDLLQLASRCGISLAAAEDALCQEGLAWDQAVKQNPWLMNDPRKEVYKLLKKMGAKRERSKKHDVWILPNHRRVSLSKTSSDWRAWKNALSDVRRVSKLPPHEKKPAPAPEAKKKGKGKKRKGKKRSNPANPERVTFGKMQMLDPSASYGHILQDGVGVGEITGDYDDFGLGFEHDFKVGSYAAEFWDLDPDSDETFSFIEHVQRDRRGEATGPGGARGSLSRLRKRVRDTLDPKFHRQSKGQLGPRQPRPRKNCPHWPARNPCPICIGAGAALLGAAGYVLGEDTR